MTSITEGRMAAQPYGRRWLAVGILLAGVLMDLIDASIVNVALPSIRVDLGTSGTALEWVVSAYLLAFAATLITAGRLGDALGRRRLFLVGVAAFGLASLGAGLAGDPIHLVTARVMQGIAAGLMSPQVLATFRSIFSGSERGAVFGIYGAAAGLAVAVGLLLGGALTDANLWGLGWRTIFLINLPIAAAVLLLGAMTIPETRARRAPRPDLLGTALLSVGIVGIVYALLEGRSLDWPAWLWLVGGSGVASLVALGWVEARRQRTSDTLLPTALFRTPAFTVGTVVQLTFSASLAGFFFVFALWLQAGEGYSPFVAGLTAIGFSAGTIVFAPMSVNLALRLGRTLLVLGGLLMAVGMVAVDLGAHLGGSPMQLWAVIPGLFIAGAGLAWLIVPLANVVMSVIPARSAGGASGVFSTAQQLGGALGVAVIGEVFFGAVPTAGFRAAFEAAAPIVAIGFLACALLSLALPRSAIEEAYG